MVIYFFDTELTEFTVVYYDIMGTQVKPDALKEIFTLSTDLPFLYHHLIKEAQNVPIVL